jgi:two-component system response regulator YesN
LIHSSGIYIGVSIGKGKLSDYGVQSHLSFKIGFEKYVYFISESGLKVLHSTLEVINRESSIKGIGLSDKIFNVDQISEATNSAKMRAYYYFTVGSKEKLFEDPSEETHPNDLIKKLDEAMDKNDFPMIHEGLDEVLVNFSNKRLNMKHAIIIYNHMINFLAKRSGELYEEYILSYDSLTKLFDNVQAMINKLKELLTHRMHENYGIKVYTTSNKSFKDVLKYVDLNFCNEISIDSISKEFYMNAPYIGQLFKKNLGVTFAEYLTQARMNHAVTLIAKTDLGLSAIAEKVGYKDYFYFSRIFKKINGHSPSFYRGNEQAMD